MRTSRWLPVLLVVGAAACGSDRPPATAPPVENETGAVAQQPETPAPIRIMPLGDSITQGDSDHDTYRRPLWKSLMADGYSVDFVGSLDRNHRGGPPSTDFDRDHEGHWGWRVDEILERIRGWTEEAEPDVVLVHLGSNDLFQGESLDSTIGDLGVLIDAVRESRPGAKFLLAQIISTDNVAANRRIADLNARIPELAASKSTPSSPVVVVDQHTGFDPASQTYDGVHPNADGEIHLSDRWLAALEEVLAP